MSIQTRLAYVMLVLILGASQLSCQFKPRGNADLNSLTVDCAATLAQAFANISEEELATSDLVNALTGYQARSGVDSIGAFLAIQFVDEKGPIEFDFDGPLANRPPQRTSKDHYA